MYGDKAMKLETERLELRPVEQGDIYDIFEYAQDEETGPRAGWPPHKTIDDTKQILNKWLDPENVEKIFVAVYKPDGKVIGTIGVVHLNERIKDEKNLFAKKLIDEGKSVYELGITLAKKYWNKGLATEGFAKMMEYIFRELKADVVLALHFEANIASKRVQEKSHMKVLGSYDREQKWYNTDCTKMVVRGITFGEWQNNNNLQKTQKFPKIN